VISGAGAQPAASGVSSSSGGVHAGPTVHPVRPARETVPVGFGQKTPINFNLSASWRM
jgi:hypothetical protein